MLIETNKLNIQFRAVIRGSKSADSEQRVEAGYYVVWTSTREKGE